RWGPGVAVPLEVQVWGDTAVGGTVRVDPADALALADFLADGDFGDDVAVDGEAAAVGGGVVYGDPPAEAGGGAGAGDGAVFDCVDGVVSGAAVAAVVRSPVDRAPAGAES